MKREIKRTRRRGDTEKRKQERKQENEKSASPFVFSERNETKAVNQSLPEHDKKQENKLTTT